MTERPFRPTLTALVVLMTCGHTVLAGSRVAVSLDALQRGASAAVVGMLIALFALLPMLFALMAGRLVDRVGSAGPLWAGTLAIAGGVLLPALMPGWTSLCLAPPLLGLGFMINQVAIQHAVAGLGGPQDRTANFGMLSLGSSIANFAGPLIAGLTIDLGGHRAAFIALALLPLAPIAILFARRRWLLRPGRAIAPTQRMRALDLLRQRPLRRLFLVNAFVAIGWDAHTAFIPVYGTQLGLSGSQIGSILACFAAASFISRISIRWMVRRWPEQTILRAAFFVAALAYLAVPLVANAWGLMALAFVLGLGLGTGQPVVMSLLQLHAPPDRLGEAAGIRITMIQSMAVSVPLVFGALGASLGLLAVFWAIAACLGCGGLVTREGAP